VLDAARARERTTGVVSWVFLFLTSFLLLHFECWYLMILDNMAFLLNNDDRIVTDSGPSGKKGKSGPNVIRYIAPTIHEQRVMDMEGTPLCDGVLPASACRKVVSWVFLFLTSFLLLNFEFWYLMIFDNISFLLNNDDIVSRPEDWTSKLWGKT
jgi:hypothetical protein